MKHTSKINRCSTVKHNQNSYCLSIATHAVVLLAAWFLLGFFCTRVVADEVLITRNLTETLHHQGIERIYHIHFPPGFNINSQAPLVIALHGGGGRGLRLDRSITNATLTAAADARGVVVVFPEAVNKHWHDGRTEHIKTKNIYDDVGFISKLIDRMVKNYGIDHRRVYATGISNGGFMSVRLAMDLSEKIAAVAPVAAQISKALEGKTPRLPISIMIVNGTKDSLVPFHGGHIRLFRFSRSRGEILSTASSVEHFRRHNQCSKVPEKTKLPDKDPGDGTKVEIEKYTGGKDGTEVVLVKIIGGGHCWPGGEQYLRAWIIGKVCRDINGSEMIIDFFLSHSRKEVSPR